MPYNTSKNVIEKMKGELDELAKGKAVTFKTASPHKLAYNIREALAAAKKHRVSAYASLDYVFKARDGKVVAIPRAESVEVETTTVVEPETPAPPPQPRKRTLERECTEFDVIQEVSKLEEGSVTFAAFVGQLEAVESWVSRRDGVNIMARAPLTIRKDG